MKVNYLPKNRLANPYLKRAILLVIIFIFGIVVFSFLRGAIISFISPIWQAENIITRNLRISLAYFGSKKALLEENIILKEKNSSLELRIMDLNNFNLPNDILLASIGRDSGEKIIVASVLTHPPQTPYDVIIIDIGSNDAVVMASEVFLPEGPVIGKVVEVFPKNSKVKLFSSSGESTNAILERNNVPVILKGVGGGNFKMAIPHDIDVEKGDRVLYPGLPARLIAIVGEINVRPTDSFKEVLARSPGNIFSIRSVFVKP